MFDLNRLYPTRLFPALKRRIKEIPHSCAWQFSYRGKENKTALESYKNLHKGETLYLLANGPSINKTNLNLLKGKRVMCMNRFYIKFKDLEFTPDYLVCIEETVLKEFSDDFKELQIPLFINWRLRNKIPNAHYIKESFNLSLFFQPDITRPTNGGGTVTFVSLQLAYYMGFDRVVILGMDHSFKETGTAGKTEVRNYEKDESHFDPNYFPKGMKWVLPDLLKSEHSYSLANQYFKKYNKEIIDSTIGGKCLVFEKRELKSVLSF